MRRRLVIFLAAAILAVISATAVMAYVRGADRRALEGRRGTWVLLATDTIAARTTGAEIRARRLVRQVMMPAETVPDGALSRLEPDLDALGLTAALFPDQMLMRRQFEPVAPASPGPSPTLPLPADRIAVSVELGTAPQVAGNVGPGDLVTVFCTSPRETTGTQPQRTVVILPRVTVLSVGESPVADVPAPATSGPAAGGTEPSVMPATPAVSVESLERYVVTVAVTQREAERLILGSHSGLLHLGLLGARASVSATPAPPGPSEAS